MKEQCKYNLEYYEANQRVGTVTPYNIEQMIKDSKLSIIVLTCDMQLENGDKIPRLNVVKELGMSLIKHGFNRCIILVEEGFKLKNYISNLDGINVIYFSKNAIMNQSGKILAVIKDQSKVF